MQKKLFFLFLIIRNVTVHQFILIVLSLNIPEVPHTTPPKKNFILGRFQQSIPVSGAGRIS